MSSRPIHWIPLRVSLLMGLLLAIGACDSTTLPPGVTLADAFRVSHVCADSFQIVNRFMRIDPNGLRVSVWASWWKPEAPRGAERVSFYVRVPWATSATDVGTIGFRAGAPAGRTISISATPTNPPGLLTTASMMATNSGPATCPVVSQRFVRVRVVQGIGVTGSVAPAADSVAIGGNFAWHFLPSEGSTAVDVRINGKRVNAYGTQVIESDVLLTAVGSTTLVTSPQLTPIINQAHALFGSSNPRAAAEKMLNDLVALLDGVDWATGDRLLAEFQSRAFPDNADLSAIARLDSLLGNSVMKIVVPTRPGIRGEAQAYPVEPTTYFIAAGILTTQEKVAATARVVRTLIRDRSMLGENDLIRSFASPTMTGLREDVRGCVARVFALTGIRDRVNGFLSYCLPVYGGLLDSNDFIEAGSQILKQWVGGIPTRETSMAFMDSLLHYRQQSYHVIVDGHSQGTLIAREAIAELAARGDYRSDRDTTCLGVVAMAGPVSGNWPLPLPFFREFATEGDIVAAMGGSTALRIPTDLTRQRDSALANTSTLNVPLRAVIYLMHGVQLHGLQEVYLGEEPPRDYLLRMNDEIRRECETESVRSSLPNNRHRISVGEEFPIGIYVSAMNWNNHKVPGPPVRITSANPLIAAMLNSIVVVGRAVGDVTLVAQSGTRIGSVVIEVPLPPLLGIGGDYAGKWIIPNPANNGALSISLAEAGSVTKDGEPQVSGSVTYSHHGESFTVPMLDGKVSLGGISQTITFRMATPEFPNPQSWASVSLQIRGNGELSGGAVLYFDGQGIRESRVWELKHQG